MATPATNKQLPDHAILDKFNKQTYLGNRFTFSLAFTSAATTEVAALYLANPASTTQAFPGQASLFVDLRQLTGAVAADNQVLRTYFNPTISVAGTTRVPINLRSGSTNVSVATLQSLPTATANGTLVETLAIGAFGSVTTSELIIVDPGKSILITYQASATSDILVPQISWSEI